MNFRNDTDLQTDRLLEMIRPCIDGWQHDEVAAAVRYSRGAEFSGSCRYVPPRIYVNIGRHNRYPYLLKTHIAPARSNDRCWWRELYTLELADAYQLAFFIFLHEFYHWLIRKARRNGRQKEGRCDRFAAQALVDRYGATVRDSAGRPVERSNWDFQDLEGFVARARQPRARRSPPTRGIVLGERQRPILVARPTPRSQATDTPAPPSASNQLLLFG